MHKWLLISLLANSPILRPSIWYRVLCINIASHIWILNFKFYSTLNVAYPFQFSGSTCVNIFQYSVESESVRINYQEIIIDSKNEWNIHELLFAKLLCVLQFLSAFVCMKYLQMCVSLYKYELTHPMILTDWLL